MRLGMIQNCAHRTGLKMSYTLGITNTWSINLILLVILILHTAIFSQAIRSRQDGLNNSISSSTAGVGNLHLTMYGRTFLWDNSAAQKLPPVLPHAELNYGLTDYFDVTGGINALSYVLSPGYLYGRAKLTTPDNKSLRFLGFAETIEMKKSLFKFFPSNGYRLNTEGFGPEGFILGNKSFITSWKFTTSADIELIRISSYLPFKLYANLGYEMEFSSYLKDQNDQLVKESKNKLKIPDQDLSLLPMSLGVELKTYTTDFFVEMEAQPFTSQIMKKIDAEINGELDGDWKRFYMTGKTFDIHLMELPVYVNSGAKLKYKNGLQLQGGISWLLSQDRGPTLGPCEQKRNDCQAGATDGFSPFYPQWKVFWLIRYPFWFTQPSSELYRSFILKRYQDKRKKVNLEEQLSAPAEPTGDMDSAERQKRLEERRKEADGKTVDLN